MSLLVTNIQRSSFFDGSGVRTTVFLKGCMLCCPWCCNPESISPAVQKIIDTESNVENLYGREYEIAELAAILIKDKPYYDASGGGVTFSGGEALLQSKQLKKCIELLKKDHIRICVETSLFCPQKHLDEVIGIIDDFIVDIKILDPVMCKKYLDGDLGIYLKNVDALLKIHKSVIFRFPVVKPHTFNDKNLSLLKSFIQKRNIKKVEIFSVHNLAAGKYESLGKKPPRFDRATKEELELIRNTLLSIDTNIIILDV